MKYQRLDVQCNECGSVFQNLTWSPKRKCPKCGSMALAPLVKVETERKSGLSFSLAKIRMKLRSKKTIALAAAVIAALIVIPKFALNGDDAVFVICSGCGESYYEMHFLKAPGSCRKCGEQDVYPAIQCAQCGTIYGDKTAEGDVEEDVDIRCPNCKSTEIKNIGR